MMKSFFLEKFQNIYDVGNGFFLTSSKMGEVKFLYQSFSMKGFVIFFTEGGVYVSQTWCRVIEFVKEAEGF